MNLSTKIQHVRQAGRGSLSDTEKVLDEIVNPRMPVKLPVFAVAGLPAAANFKDHVVICSNGGGGNAILAFSDGTNWKRSDTGGNVATS